MLQVIPSFLGKFWESSLFILSDYNEDFLVCHDYSVASQNPAHCNSINCEVHILCIASEDNNDVIGKQDRLCFTHENVDCFYTLFKFRFSGNLLVKFGELLDSLERVVSFNKVNKELDKIPSLAKKRFLRRKFNKHLLTSIQKSVAVQTSVSVFVEQDERAKRNKFELLKVTDCFLHGYRSYESNLVSFRINFFK